MTKTLPRVLIAGTSSGSGKTTAVCAILALLKRRGIDVISAKCGPDYIDPTPHECRHTFRSRLDSAGANKVCIDLMMGHKSLDVGERVYTHKTIEELQSTIILLN